jgi:homoserine O-acetyltransferase
MTMRAAIIRLALAIATLDATVTADAHQPGQPAHQSAQLGALELEDGGSIDSLRMSYVTHGTLSPAKDNAILVLDGWATSHHALDHLIGPGKALDTDRYFIVCSDELGSTQTDFEHSTSPTNSGLKMRFPKYNGRDQVRAEHRLVTQGLGITHLLAVVGVSAGAERTVQMAISHPGFMDAIVPISGGVLWTTQGYNFRPLLADVVESCAGWSGGNYDSNPASCATTAAAIFVPYFYTRDWWERHAGTPEAYRSWRRTVGAAYLDNHDARDLYYLQVANDLGWVGDTPGFDGDLGRILQSIKAQALFVSSPNDELVPKRYVEMQVNAIPGARVAWIESEAGHLACCNADPHATQVMDRIIGQLLAEVVERRKAVK